MITSLSGNSVAFRGEIIKTKTIKTDPDNDIEYLEYIKGLKINKNSIDKKRTYNKKPDEIEAKPWIQIGLKPDNKGNIKTLSVKRLLFYPRRVIQHKIENSKAERVYNIRENELPKGEKNKKLFESAIRNITRLAGQENHIPEQQETAALSQMPW